MGGGNVFKGGQPLPLNEDVVDARDAAEPMSRYAGEPMEGDTAREPDIKPGHGRTFKKGGVTYQLPDATVEEADNA